MIQFPLPGTTQVFGAVNQAPLRDLKMTFKHILYVHSQKHWDSELKLVGVVFFFYAGVITVEKYLCRLVTKIYTADGPRVRKSQGECQGKGCFVPAERSSALPVSV